MKKIIIVVLLLSTIFLVGCSNSFKSCIAECSRIQSCGGSYNFDLDNKACNQTQQNYCFDRCTNLDVQDEVGVQER